jgi:hypothetical protein
MKSTKIFVFGSNLAGIHGAGAAKEAVINHGAIMHQGRGLQGNSYAIPTKNQVLATRSLRAVKFDVDEFIFFALEHPELEFQITQIGCGLAGFKAEEIAPLFRGAPSNCTFDEAWKPWLDHRQKFWGTFS